MPEVTPAPIAEIAEVTVSFNRADTADPHCAEYADNLYTKFTTRAAKRPGVGAYQDGASLLVLPETYDAWWDAVGYYTRRRVRKAEKAGFEFRVIERDDYLDDIFAINTSMEERQGRPMKDTYLQRPGPYGPMPAFGCPRHRLAAFGVLREGHLYAYTWVFQVGEMCLFSTILGHGDHLADGIMFQLIAGALRELIPTAGTRYAMYNMHQSGTDGLKFFKEQMGFAPYWVNWQLADEPVGNRAETLAVAAKLVPRISLTRRARRYAGRVVRGVRRRIAPRR
jgi:hypothetical protein